MIKHKLAKQGRLIQDLNLGDGRVKSVNCFKVLIIHGFPLHELDTRKVERMIYFIISFKSQKSQGNEK